jgi:hypothetical protein
MDGVYEYLHDFAYETTPAQAAAVFADLPVERRQTLLDHMIAIARPTRISTSREERFVARIADMLGFDITEGDTATSCPSSQLDARKSRSRIDPMADRLGCRGYRQCPELPGPRGVRRSRPKPGALQWNCRKVRSVRPPRDPSIWR